MPKETRREATLRNVNRDRFMSFMLYIFIKIDRKLFVERQVKRMAAMAFNEIITDQIGKKLIRKYFCYRRNTESVVMIHFRCYNTCEVFLRNTERVFNENEIHNCNFVQLRTINRMGPNN